jgi:Dyp-type peroxidase family
MITIKNEDRQDIQGLLIYGYARLKAACYIFFTIEDRNIFKKWLKASEFQNGLKSPQEYCMNIAFTREGLKAIMDPEPICKENGFDLAFTEGMDTEHRNRILGDYDLNDPSKWKWGNKDDRLTHGVLMLFAKDENTLEGLYKKEVERFKTGGVRERYKINSVGLPDNKEHFGFTDGISQPVMRGLDFLSREDNYVNPGEFILGHFNEYDKCPASPKFGDFEFGNNGSYMVVREIEQDVKKFWKTICRFAGNTNGTDPIKIASEMCGRWPNGIPLVYTETEEEAIRLKNEKAEELRQSPNEMGEGKEKKPTMISYLNDFNYYQNDSKGLKCPLGSHVRRANPKDSSNDDPKNPNRVTNRHRMLRRGRPYGKPFVETMDIRDIIKSLDKNDNESRGLTFVCFNTDIKRQFEFVQQTWLNNIKFLGLYDEVDPIAGVRGRKREIQLNQFTEAAAPIRNRYNDLPTFTTIKGGSYFFFPGFQALAYMWK